MIQFFTKLLFITLVGVGGVKALPHATIWMMEKAAEATQRGFVSTTKLNSSLKISK